MLIALFVIATPRFTARWTLLAIAIASATPYGMLAALACALALIWLPYWWNAVARPSGGSSVALLPRGDKGPRSNTADA